LKNLHLDTKNTSKAENFLKLTHTKFPNKLIY
jgi:hypothetical protein